MSAPPRNFILATAGHVDHGKSSLIRALTGVDTDRLIEEKKRGISIELGFAPLLLTGSNDSSLSIGIVDVPGHEDFVKTMVSGIAAADAALLVVAADDGPMPQTFEHLQILECLGVRGGLIALSKIDRVSDVDAANSNVRTLLAHTHFAQAPIVPISVVSGDGLDALRQAIGQMLGDAPPPRDVGKPRLWIDRAFIQAGVGTIATGTLIGGTLSVGQSVCVQPSERKLRIRSLQSHHRAITTAAPGSRVAISLPDASVDPTGKRGVARGQLLTLESVGVNCDLLDARLSCPSPSLPRDGVEISFHLGTTQSAARLCYYDPPAEGFVRLKLIDALPAMIGDRFILRSSSGNATLGGGVILDPLLRPDRQWRKNLEQLRLLITRDSCLHDVARVVESQLERSGYASTNELQKVVNTSKSDFHQTVAQLSAEGTLKAFADTLVGSAFLSRLLDETVLAVRAFHREFPHRPGLPLPAVQKIVRRWVRHNRVAAESIFQGLLRNLTARNIARSADVLRLRSFSAALPPRLETIGERLRSVLAADGLNVASRKELTPTDSAAEALRFLIANREAIELGPDLAISAAAYDSAADAVRQHLSSRGPSTVSEIKSLLQSSRRVVVPLLERFDRDGITRRRGDLREIGPSE